ncbi:MAG: leucine-rich repeat protein [Lachnospiraceae bacterium]|nr:leucine-rich repeat protein [Lachnospiraceae bacterium]
MRKQLKKVLSMVLSAAMVLTLGSGLELKTADAAAGLTVAGEFNAKISSNIDADENGDWTWADIATSKVDFASGDAVTVELKHEGSYAGADDQGQLVFCVDVVGLNAAATASGNAIALKDISIKLDGVDFPVDKTKVITGDLENNGNYRVEIYNVWGKGTASNPPIDLAKFKYNTSLEVKASLEVVKAPDPTPTPEVATPSPKPTRDPSITAAPRPTEVTTGSPEILTSKGIHAYLFYQTNGNYDCRNAYEAKKLNNQYGPNYIKAGGVEGYDADEFEVVDVKLDHDGEYTVSLGGIDLSGNPAFNMLGIATDLDSAAYPGVTATLSALQIDGTAVAAPANKTLASKGDASFYTFMVVNSYAEDGEIVPYAVDEVSMPEQSISITFTIAGLEEALMDIDAGIYTQPDNGDTKKPGAGNDPTPTPGAGTTPTQKPGTTPTQKPGGSNPSPTPGQGGTGTGSEAVVGAKVGASVTVGAFKLKVTKAATTKSAGTATVTGLSKSGKKAKSLNVKASMKKGAASYKVNAIGKKAFKGAKATKITLNKNIKTIPASAFANCKKLNKLKIDAKLKKVAKKAFKGCKKKIAVSGKNKKANVKLLKKSGYKKFK